jgi:hypothetical protein
LIWTKFRTKKGFQHGWLLDCFGLRPRNDDERVLLLCARKPNARKDFSTATCWIASGFALAMTTSRCCCYVPVNPMPARLSALFIVKNLCHFIQSTLSVCLYNPMPARLSARCSAKIFLQFFCKSYAKMQQNIKFWQEPQKLFS